MRTKSSPVLYFDFSGEASIKVAQEYRAKYQAISDLLDANGALLALAHRDWARLLKLVKCYFKGFKNYAASVGLAVLCHNLVLLTRL